MAECTSFLVQSLLHKLASPELIEYVKYSNLNILKLCDLETKFLKLHSVLEDAEQKQFFNPKIQTWLQKLYKDISVAEEILDTLGYDSLHCKVNNAQPTHHSNFDPLIKDICTRLEGFVLQIPDLDLQPLISPRICRRMHSPSISVNESIVIGRNDDRHRLMSMLFPSMSIDNGGTGTLGVIAILGIAGVGKSTLARLVYNDRETEKHFDLKVWVPIMLEDFDMFRVTKALYESVSSSTYSDNDLNRIRLGLKQYLMQKRFLFVFDDLQNINYDDWHSLVTLLDNGNSGSRVIITTRHDKVAQVSHTFPIHRVEPLSNKHCCSLLSKHAYGTNDITQHPNLQAICRKIAKKCNGLPIVAKTIGGILSTDVNSKHWNSVLNDTMWDISSDVMPGLLLSYQCIPSHLKRCFTYCSIFPKGYRFDKNHMVLLWMAQGFIENSVDEKAAEEVGNDYFAELLLRSLIEQVNDDTDKGKFVMNNLIHDLASTISVESRCSHLSYYQEEYDDINSLRTLLHVGLLWKDSPLSLKVVKHLRRSTISRLRVLSLSNDRKLNVLPDSIRSLTHLRYLNLYCSSIRRLPETICELYYLQSLILCGCMNLKELPADIGKLISLCHLNISWTKITELPADIGKLISLRHLNISGTKITDMPTQIAKLENLETLTVFIVGNQEVGGLSVKALGKHPKLRGKLCIQNLHNVVDVSEACDANLKGKEDIEELDLYWNREFKDPLMDKVVFDELQPSTNLKKLSISFYGGTNFPSWLGDFSFSNMVYLCIKSCDFCTTLPPLGQLPSLKDLEINDMRRVETIGSEFYGITSGGSFRPFPALEKLKIESMSNWKKWHSFRGKKSPFPRLKTLKLTECPELEFPIKLPSSLEDLEFGLCPRLQLFPQYKFPSSLKRFFILECPLLEAWYETEGREHLSNIAHLRWENSYY